MEHISKTEFKAHALEIFRKIEESGQPRIITDRGRPKLEIRKLRESASDPLEVLRDSVLKYEDPFAPVADGDWENA